jgi:leucine-zipper-like transcriptional regulator 1
MHSADYVASKKEVFVFRGGNGREYLNDLHALHVESLTWRRVETNGAVPQQRANHSSAILEDTGELFIFGGWYVSTTNDGLSRYLFSGLTHLLVVCC